MGAHQTSAHIKTVDLYGSPQQVAAGGVGRSKAIIVVFLKVLLPAP
jgi:hypothetical protein